MMKKFYWMWFGQLLSILTSGITSFALGIWLLKQTESVTDYAVVIVIATLPGILLTPFIGSLVDRHSRKKVMILADVTAAITTLCIAILYYIDALALTHIYVIAAIDSVALAFQIPAATAAITLLVPKENLGKAAGMNELSSALSTIAAPFLAGLLINLIDISGILILDLVTFLIAAGVLYFIDFPHPKERPPSTPSTPATLWAEAKEGWRYITQRKGLRYILIYTALLNLLVGMEVVSVMPMVLQLTTEAGAGLILSAGGIGALLGGAYLTVNGGPKRKINGLLFGSMMAAICLFFIGFQPITWLIAIALLLYDAALTIAYGSEQVIWQHKVEPSLQGRVFSASGAISSLMLPIGSLTAGLLADKVFEPAMQSGGVLANTVGVVIGSGPGRGLAFIFVLLAVLLMFVALWGWNTKAVRCVEDDLPDAIED